MNLREPRINDIKSSELATELKLRSERQRVLGIRLDDQRNQLRDRLLKGLEGNDELPQLLE